jgi:hypothetical protein
VRVPADQAVNAALAVDFPDGEQSAGPLGVECEILPEATVLGEGGDFEPRPEPLEGLIRRATTEVVEFTSPATPGAYRLFVYIHDEHNRAATANLPFLVEER